MLIVAHKQIRSCRAPRSASRRSAIRTVCFKEAPQHGSTPFLNDLPTQSNYTVDAKDTVLGHAEQQLHNLCSGIRDPAEADKCWAGLNYLKRKHSSFLKGCSREVEQGSPSLSCQELEKLDQMVRELETGGSLANLYKVFSLMDRAESRCAENPASKEAEARRHARFAEMEAEDKLLRDEAVHMFHMVDTNGDGKIDVGEFREALHVMAKHFTGDDVAVFLSCLDAHGFIEKDQFVDIVLAEKIRMKYPDCDAEFLRHVLHRHPAWMP